MFLQPVKTHEYVGACRYTGYIPKSIKLILECGHEQHRKASQGVPRRAHCRECEHADQDAVDRLVEAVRKTNRYHSLPRCHHGSALRDGGGEALEPPCGCRASDVS